MNDAALLSERSPRPSPDGLADVPKSYARAQAEILALLAPSNLLERHYTEKIAAAGWRLERLRRWQARLWEDDTLTDDERLTKLDSLLRHETNLNRQIDTTVKMLNKDVPRLCKGRVHTSPAPDCQNEPAARAAAVPSEGRPPSERDLAPRSVPPRADDGSRTRQTEPAPASSPSGSPLPRVGEGLGVGASSGLGVGASSDPLTLTAKGRLVPARADARRLLFSR